MIYMLYMYIKIISHIYILIDLKNKVTRDHYILS